MRFKPGASIVLLICILGMHGQTTAQEPLVATGESCMVSSAQPIATEAGIRILRDGGNAFDAAVAIAATLNVVEPMNSGMGGYGTILIYDARNNRVRFLDSSGKIPVHLDSDVFRTPTPDFMKNRRGPKSVSTPGNINAWEAMSNEYGNLDWVELFRPAIKVARDGFPVDKNTASVIAYAYDDFPDHAKVIYGKEGRALKNGEQLVQADLARSLEMVATQGSRVFYEGQLAQAIHEEMQTQGSFLSIDDLKTDQAEWWEPAHIDYRGYKVFTASPPATAFPSLIRLGMMSRLADKNFQHNSADYLHHFAEITKHAFWCRLMYAGDPEMTPPPLANLFSEKYWDAEVAKIDPKQATRFEPPNIQSSSSDNTTHFVVADRWGNIVCATQTLGNVFGSRIMPKGTGIWFNNSLAYCTFEPKGNPMDAKPGQRKLSGDCPTIVFRDGQPWAALGTPGGHTIGQTVPQMVMNLIDFEMNISEAIAAPRISFVEPNWLVVEDGVSEEVTRELEERGHQIRRRQQGLGNAHGLRVKLDADHKLRHYEGAADPRGNGKAEGF